ncbi:MAG: hypothetical protein NVS3B21_23500 [Acidimicrobiales bacterium]
MSVQGDDREVLAMFRYTLRADADTAELGRLHAGLSELARTTPEFGYLGLEHFQNADGVQLVVYRFRSIDGMNGFVGHPQHRAIQLRGAEFFASLQTQICMLERESDFDPKAVLSSGSAPSVG